MDHSQKSLSTLQLQQFLNEIPKRTLIIGGHCFVGHNPGFNDSLNYSGGSHYQSSRLRTIWIKVLLILGKETCKVCLRRGFWLSKKLILGQIIIPHILWYGIQTVMELANKIAIFFCDFGSEESLPQIYHFGNGFNCWKILRCRCP